MKKIPTHELEIQFVRSSGPGGQNVNKSSTKALVRWNIGRSLIFKEDEKIRIRDKLKNKLNQEDEILVSSDRFRSQDQNREDAIQKIQHWVSDALKVKKKRRKTRRTQSSNEKRLSSKSKRAEHKSYRKKVTSY